MSRKFLPIYLLLLLLAADAQAAAASGEPVPDQVQAIQTIADEFSARLDIEGQVFVQVVGQDKRLVSVRRSSDQKDQYLLCFDRNFLTALTDEELRAAVAHEFGHIWIFTHHPYLQTEDLANRTAMLLVSRESLEKVYTKVTQFSGKRLELKTD